MNQRPLLLPAPRQLRMTGGASKISASPVRRQADDLHEQGYRLIIDGSSIVIESSTDQGAFYAEQTLAQLRRQFRDTLPRLEITDWPDFPARGVMLDIGRDKVPTMATIFQLVDYLAAMKINQLQLYTEHTFAYAGHEEVWRDASPLTAEEVRQLDAYCKARFVELVPNQNSFGHMERWLKHPKYLDLAEAPDGAKTPWGDFFWEGPFSLNPTDPKSIELLRDLYSQLLPNFSSKLLNVGCDETFDIGQGKSKAEAERRGSPTRLYLDFLCKVNDLVQSFGRTMMFWGDIIIHKPELIAEIPKGVIALEWGYDWNSPFDKNGKMFADAGVPFYVCPGTSSWLTILGRTDNAIANLKSAAENGLKHGAIGFLNTDWGDMGHLQYLPISYLGFAAGAAYSWCFETNQNLNIVELLDLHVFRDRAKVMGQIAFDLGNIYQMAGEQLSNSSRLFWPIIIDKRREENYRKIPAEQFDAIIERIGTIAKRIDQATMDRPDAKLMQDEFRAGAKMLQYSCRRGKWLNDRTKVEKSTLRDELKSILTEHRRLWLARNRPGGLSDSARRLEQHAPEYA